MPKLSVSERDVFLRERGYLARLATLHRHLGHALL